MAFPSATRVAAILVAAGTGTRLAESKGSTPKQFLQLSGKPLYYWSLSVLAAHPRVEKIVVVTLPEMFSRVNESFASVKSSARIDVVSGGATRQESVFNGLKALPELEPADIVLVHDAARPFLTSSIVDATISGVEAYGACTAAIPASDTIKRVRNDFIEETLDRNCLVVVQTPQAARFDWLYSAHELASARGRATTDDAALLEAAGHQVKVVPGHAYNIKITHKEDLVLAEALAQVLFNDRHIL